MRLGATGIRLVELQPETYEEALARARRTPMQLEIPLRRPKRRIRADSATAMFHRLRMRSERKGVPFDLTETWLRQQLATATHCSITGIKFDDKPRGSFSRSIDRIDSTKGYTKDNVQFVVWIYNAAKGPHSHDDVVTLAKRLLGVDAPAQNRA